MAVCWHCHKSEYHDYKDKHGIRCPLCGQREADSPGKAKPAEVVEIRLPAKKAAASTRRSK